MLATLTSRQNLVGRHTSRRKFGAISAILLLIVSTAFFYIYRLTDIINTYTGFYVIVTAGTILACFTAYQQSGLLLSLAQTLGAIFGVVFMYRGIEANSYIVGAPVERPFYVYGLNAIEFWIPAGILLGTLAFVVGISLRWMTDR